MPPAGWYPTGDASVERFWDGAAWAEHHRSTAARPPAPSTGARSAKVALLRRFSKRQKLVAAALGALVLTGGVGLVVANDGSGGTDYSSNPNYIDAYNASRSQYGFYAADQIDEVCSGISSQMMLSGALEEDFRAAYEGCVDGWKEETGKLPIE